MENNADKNWNFVLMTLLLISFKINPLCSCVLRGQYESIQIYNQLLLNASLQQYKRKKSFNQYSISKCPLKQMLT